MKKVITALTLVAILAITSFAGMFSASAAIGGDPVLNKGDVLYSCDFSTMPEGTVIRSAGDAPWVVKDGALWRDGTDAQKNCYYYFKDTEQYVSGDAYIIAVDIKIDSSITANMKGCGICTVTVENIDPTTQSVSGHTYTIIETYSDGRELRVNTVQGTAAGKWSNLHINKISESPYEWHNLALLVQGYQVDVFYDNTYVSTYFRESTHSQIAFYAENKASVYMDNLTVYEVKEEEPTETTDTEAPEATDTKAPEATDTKAPDTAADTVADSTADTTGEEKSGCGATVSVGLVGITALGACAVTVRRKRTRERI